MAAKNPKTYPFIRAYCQMMGSYPYYVREQLEAAAMTNAPADAYASKVDPPEGPDDWFRVTAMDDFGRKRIERFSGFNAQGELAKHGEAEEQ